MKVDNVFLQNESTQPFGSYKIRGVRNFFARNKGLKSISTASAGNLGQAVASFSREAGIPCTLFIPDSCPEVKRQAMLALGATLVPLPFEELWKLVTREGALPNDFIHPLAADLLEGYGLILDDVLRDFPEAHTLLVPFGLGGLTLGLLRRRKLLKANIKITAAEIATAAPLSAALRAGFSVRVAKEKSFVDAIGSFEVLPEIFEAIYEEIDGSVVVTEEEALGALAQLAFHQIKVEGAAAVAFAAAQKVEGPVCAILSGRNINPALYTQLLDKGVLVT
jgi:threonine dehydratase